MELIEDDELYIQLFVCLKFWANQRGLLFSIEDTFIHGSEQSVFFDSILLMFYMIFYLKQIKEIPTFEVKDTKQPYIIQTEISGRKHWEKFTCKAYAKRKKKGPNPLQLAKLFVGFFYFNVNLIEGML